MKCNILFLKKSITKPLFQSLTRTMATILKDKGNEAFKAENYLEADAFYKSASVLDPSDPILYSNRAMSLIKLENWVECIEVCINGLALSPDLKTKTKLLWRKGTAYSNLQDFKNAKLSYEEALDIDPNNSATLKSLHELNSQENQFKRSHSIDSSEPEKRIRANNIEKINIYEVDELPKEFRSRTKTTAESSSQGPRNDTRQDIQQRSSESFQDVKPLIIQTTKTQSATSKASNTSIHPQTPTSFQLMTILKSAIKEPSSLLDTYEYIFSIAPQQYSQIFQGGSIDSQFLDFFIDSITHSITINKSNISKAVDLVKAIEQVPRFNLVKLLIKKQKLENLQQTIIKNGGTNTNVLLAWE